MKFELEKVFLAVFVTVFLLIGIGFLWDNQLKHDFPYGYLASDSFQHQVRAESIKDAGNYRNEAPYIVFGIENVIGYYPPMLYHLSVLFSYASGLPVYDTAYFIPFFGAMIAALLIFFLIRSFNRQVAILALPFSVLVFAGALYTGFTWGHWPSLTSQFFLAAFIWSLGRFDLKKHWILPSFFFSAIIMTHTSEAIFAGLFLMLYLGHSWLIKDLDKKKLLNVVKMALLTAVLSSYYLIIFRGIWMVRQPFQFNVVKAWGAPLLFAADFKALWIFLAVGIITSAWLIKKKEFFVPLVSITLLLFGYTNYLGFTDRAFQLRFFWPITLAFLFGMGIYQLGKVLIKSWKTVYSVAIAAVFLVLLTTTSTAIYPTYQKIISQGLMDNGHWEGLGWIAKNTPQDAKVYFLYGDIYSQDALLRNVKRMHFLVVPDDYIQAINDREIKQRYETEQPGDGGGGAAQRTALLGFEFPTDDPERRPLNGEADICIFDYYIVDKAASQPALAQYNILLANEMLKTGWIKPVFENEIMVILKNENPGADCIEERNF